MAELPPPRAPVGQSGRILTAGISTTMLFGLMAWMGWSANDAASEPAPTTPPVSNVPTPSTVVAVDPVAAPVPTTVALPTPGPAPTVTAPPEPVPVPVPVPPEPAPVPVAVTAAPPAPSVAADATTEQSR